MRPLHRLRGVAVAGALAVAAALAPTAARAQSPLSLGVWTPFSWFDGVGPITDPGDGFFLALLGPGRLRLTDAYGAGDAFDLYVDGALALATPAVAPGLDGWAAGEAAWADPALSKGELLLDPGDHRLAIRVRVDAGFGYGDGFVRADLVSGGTTVPEPAALWLLAPGLAALGALRRARTAAR